MTEKIRSLTLADLDQMSAEKERYETCFREFKNAHKAPTQISTIGVETIYDRKAQFGVTIPNSLIKK